MIRILKGLLKFKTYAREIGLEKGGWIKVSIDYLISHFVYGFDTEDYFIIGNGYTLSKYEKKRFFTKKHTYSIFTTFTIN